MKQKKSSARKTLAIGAASLLLAGFTVVALDDYASGRDVLSNQLGSVVNKAMLVSSQFGMGVAEVYDESQRTTSDEPSGVVRMEKVKNSPANHLPRGVTVKGEPVDFASKQSRELHRASREAFISAKKVEIYGK